MLFGIEIVFFTWKLNNRYYHNQEIINRNSLTEITDRGCEYSSRSKMAPNSIVVVPPEPYKTYSEQPCVAPEPHRTYSQPPCVESSTMYPEHFQISRQIPAVDSLEIVAAECCEQMGAEFHHVQSATPDVLEMNEAQYEPKVFVGIF